MEEFWVARLQSLSAAKDISRVALGELPPRAGRFAIERRRPAAGRSRFLSWNFRESAWVQV